MAKTPIPDDWDGSSWCEWAICWPDSELYEGLLRGLITSLTRGRYWDEETGEIINAQDVGFQILLKNIPLRGCIVSCTDGIEAAFNRIADALMLQAANCCSGGGVIPGGSNGGVVGNVTTPTTEETYVMVGEELPFELPSGQTYPEEYFESESAYLDYKCAAANQIIDGAIATLRNLGALTIANMVGAATIIGLAFAGAIAFPPAGIPILLAALGILVGSFVLLKNLGDYISTNRSDYVCALYNSADTETAIGLILELIDEAMLALTISASLQPHVRMIAAFIFSTDTINRLYNALLEYSYTGADCSGCEEVACTDDLTDQLEIGEYGTEVSRNVISADVVEITGDSEYAAGEDHELLDFKLKSAYLAETCGVYINGFTYVSGPGSEANVDTVWTAPGGSGNPETNPDVVHLIESVRVVQAGSISPGTFRGTYRFERNNPS